MFFYYPKQGDRVAFFSDTYRQYDNFDSIEVNLSTEEEDKLKQHYILFARNGTLVFEQPEADRMTKKTLLDKLNAETLTFDELARFILS